METPRARSARLTIALLLSCLCCAMRAGASVAVLGPLAYESIVQPGTSYEGSVEIQNSSEEAQQVRFYQADYFLYADGRTEFGEAGRLSRSNARWITVAPAEITLPAGEKAMVRYVVNVPDDATLKGSYWSVLMVEPVAGAGAETIGAANAAKSTVSIQQVLRYAVQIVTQIGSTGTVQLRFVQLQLPAEGGARSLIVDVENTGDRWYRAGVSAELYGADGAYVGKFDAGTLRAYPGTSVRFTLDLAGVAKGSYKALIVADCGGDDVFGANVPLVLN